MISRSSRGRVSTDALLSAFAPSVAGGWSIAALLGCADGFVSLCDAAMMATSLRVVRVGFEIADRETEEPALARKAQNLITCFVLGYPYSPA